MAVEKSTLMDKLENTLGEVGIIFSDYKLKAAFGILCELTEIEISKAKLDIADGITKKLKAK